MFLFWELFYKVQLKVLHQPEPRSVHVLLLACLIQACVCISVDVAANSQEAPPPTDASSSPSPWLQQLACCCVCQPDSPPICHSCVHPTHPQTSLFTVTEAFQYMLWCNNDLCCSIVVLNACVLLPVERWRETFFKGFHSSMNLVSF